MFAGRIVSGTLDRTNRSLAGHSALQLSSDLLGGALFQRIGASARHQGERAEERQGFHLSILGNDRGIAIAESMQVNR